MRLSLGVAAEATGSRGELGAHNATGDTIMAARKERIEMTRLDDTARSAFLAEHPEWEISGETLQRQFVFVDFAAAIAFVVHLAFAAEAADHHPDVDIRWNKVTIALTTHDAGALTAKDTSLAAEITALAGQ